MKRLLFITLLFPSLLLMAQSTPPPMSAYISNGSGGWTPATTTDTAGQAPFAPPPVGVYCYNSGTGKWVPATSTCLGGGGGGGAPTGPAGGVLSGTYPNPGLAGPVPFNLLGSGTALSDGFVLGNGTVLTTSGTGINNANELNGTLLSGLASGLYFNTTATGVPSIATAAQVNAVIQGLTGCNTVTNVYVPQGGTCVAPGGSGISGLTAGFLPIAGTATTITGNSHIDDGITNASILTSTERFLINGGNHLTVQNGTNQGEFYENASGQTILQDHSGYYQAYTNVTASACCGEFEFPQNSFVGFTASTSAANQHIRTGWWEASANVSGFGSLQGTADGTVEMGGLAIGGTRITNEDVAGTQSQIAPYTGTVTLNGSCGATATSCTITGGASLNANGGYVLVGYQDGSNDQEYICYSAATSTTLTIGGGNCGTPVTTAGRSYFATTAATHATGNQVVQVLWIDAASISTTPRAVRFGNGGNGDSSWGSLNPNTLGHNTGTMIGDTLYIAGNGACLSSNPTNTNLGLCLTLANGSLEWSNTASNPALITAGTTLGYAITTQAITGNGTLTAITNAKTPTMPNNNTTAAAGAGGVLSSHCTIIWNQATSGTVGFGVKASAAPTDLWVKEQDQIGTALAPIFTTITSTTTTATSGTVTPTAFGTTYASDIWLAMNPGTSNSVSVQLYAQASANTITIEPGTGCTAWQ